MHDTRLQMHYALQAAAGVGRTLLPPAPDDSHHSFTWSRERDALVQPGSGLRLRDLTLVTDDGASYPLRGHTLDEAYRFYEERAGRMLVRPAEPLPEHAVAHGAAFDAPDDELAAMATLYARAAEILERVRAKHPDASDVRLWPHHFDIAILIGNIGAGFLAGDENIDEPYWYVHATPMPDVLPPLTAGFWYDGAWRGAVLTKTLDTATSERFLGEAIEALSRR